ncbi:MAG: hypothetical protein CTY15_02245 [Methylocystis sp.]|nr:MAG: hypothetical protein CTY15_02245 [Methylocystis sp.]
MLCFCFFAQSVAAATSGKIYFFATREACAASGAFTRAECVAAFINSSALMQDRAPRFSSSSECRQRFQLCELRPAEGERSEAAAYAETDALAYAPVALGVEMILTARGVEAAPTLAVETSAQLFPRLPVSRSYEPEEATPPETKLLAGQTTILRADRFEPFPKKKPMDVQAAFSPFAAGGFEPSPLREAATHDADAQESLAERRARLRRAPFIE